MNLSKFRMHRLSSISFLFILYLVKFSCVCAIVWWWNKSSHGVTVSQTNRINRHAQSQSHAVNISVTALTSVSNASSIPKYSQVDLCDVDISPLCAESAKREGNVSSQFRFLRVPILGSDLENRRTDEWTTTVRNRPYLPRGLIFQKCLRILLEST